MKQPRQIQELLDDGNIYDSVNARGGFGVSGHQITFMKVAKNKIVISESGSWSSDISDKHNQHLAIITDKYIEFTDSDSGNSWWNNRGIRLLGSLGEFETYGKKTFPVKIQYQYNANFVVLPDGTKIIPYNKMRFTWDGEIVDRPKASIKQTEVALQGVRDIVNSKSRARYRSNKADRDFRKHRENGTIETWDFKEVLAIKNAQVRQQAIELIGINKVLNEFPMSVLDSNTVDGRPYELLEIEIPNNHTGWNNGHAGSTKKVVYLKMTNPSTGEYHMEGVPRKIDNNWDYIPEDTVIGALAWRDGETERVGYGDEERIEWKYSKPIVLT